MKKKTSEAFKDAIKETGAEADKPPIAASKPEPPKPVRGGRMMAHYLTAHLHRSKDDDALISLEFSFPLTADHEGLLPPQVESAWKVIKKSDGEVSRMDVRRIKPQTVAIYLVPDDDEAELTVVGADIDKAFLSIIKEKGKGKAQTVVRYRFHMTIERTSDVVKFAMKNDGDLIWLSTKATQASLLKD